MSALRIGPDRREWLLGAHSGLQQLTRTQPNDLSAHHMHVGRAILNAWDFRPAELCPRRVAD
jgi:hypothetical protein